MAGENRGPSADLDPPSSQPATADLFVYGHTVEYYQAIRLLRRMAQAGEDRPSPEDGHIRVRPALNLGFATTDIQSIRVDRQARPPRYDVTVNFFGLYGTSSPLPTFYTEDLMTERRQDDSVARDFMDVIHHRLYHLLFRSWLKYRQFLQVAEENSEAHLERLFCLMGMGGASMRQAMPHARRLLRYIGLFTQYPRSAAGLLTLLRDALDDVPLQLVPCISRMAKIPESQQMRMGRSGSRLGADAFLGEEIEDRMGKFRIRIGPLKKEDFLRFTPGNPGHAELVALTELYVVEPFEYELELILAAQQAQTVRLGDAGRSVLGVTTWVFSQESLGEVRIRFAVNRS